MKTHFPFFPSRLTDMWAIRSGGDVRRPGHGSHAANAACHRPAEAAPTALGFKDATRVSLHLSTLPRSLSLSPTSAGPSLPFFSLFFHRPPLLELGAPSPRHSGHPRAPKPPCGASGTSPPPIPVGLDFRFAPPHPAFHRRKSPSFPHRRRPSPVHLRQNQVVGKDPRPLLPLLDPRRRVPGPRAAGSLARRRPSFPRSGG